MIEIDKGSTEDVLVPVSLTGVEPSQYATASYFMAFPQPGMEPEQYVWNAATYSTTNGELACLFDAKVADYGYYRIKIQARGAVVSPVKDCGWLKVK